MLNTREITRIACKLLGLLFLVGAVGSFPLIAQGIVSLFIEGERPIVTPFGFTFVPFIYLIAAAIFLKYPEAITDRFIKEEQESHTESAGSWQKGFYEICLRLIGIYAIVQALPNVINIVVNIVILTQSQSNVPIHYWSSGIGSVIHLGLGVYLLTGGRLFTQLADNLRDKSSPTVSDPL